MVDLHCSAAGGPPSDHCWNHGGLPLLSNWRTIVGFMVDCRYLAAGGPLVDYHRYSAMCHWRTASEPPDISPTDGWQISIDDAAGGPLVHC